MRLNYLPSILFFGMPMGLIGAGLNARHLIELFNIEFDFSIAILFYGWIAFVFVLTHYLWHLVNATHRNKLIQEWYDPFRRSFLPSVSLTSILFLMSIYQVLDTYYLIDQAWLFYAILFVATAHFLLNIFLVNGWLFDSSLQLNHHKPTWFILLSANFVIVIALMSLFGTRQTPWVYEVSYLFFSIGLFLWLAFSTSLFYRLIFNEPLQVQLRPSLFIFLAPPSLACVASLFVSDAYIHSGIISIETVNIVTWFSYGFASMMLLVWLVNYRFFMKGGITMAGWSYVYPLAAYGLASQYLAQALESQFMAFYSIFIFIAVLSLIIILSFWLVKAALQYNENKVA